MLFQFHDKNKESLIGSDSLLFIDNRLSNENKIEVAKTKIKSIQRIKPHFQAESIARFNGQKQATGFIKL